MKKSSKKLMLIFLLIALIAPCCLYVIGANSTINYQCDDESYLSNNYEIEYGNSYELPQVMVSATLPLVNLTRKLNYTITNNIDDTKLGEYVVKYDVNTLLHKDNKEITVKVVDHQAPTINLVTDPDYYIEPNEEYIEEGYSAYDNYDQDISDKVVITKNDNNTITYSVSDSSGNYTEVTRQIKIKDVEAPVLTISAKYLTIQLGNSYKIPSYSANDNIDGDITSNVKVTNNINKNKVGTYKITYSVSDYWGNETNSSIDVYVYEKQADNVSANPDGKNIYLTFDDGPSGYTEKLLNILDKYNVKVTFFATNVSPSYQSMIGEAYRRGHTIAVHTYTHNYGKIYASSEAFWQDMSLMNDIIYEQTGTYSKYYRFPGGSSNTVSKFNKGIMTQLAKEMGEKGYQYFDWNVSSGDAGGTKDTTQVFYNVSNSCSKRKNSVVLQHDSKGYSVDAVDRIVAWGLANGYTFLVIDDNAPTAHHRIAN